jgi:hypothetical protein
VAHPARDKPNPDLVAAEASQFDVLDRCWLPDLAQHDRFHGTKTLIGVIATYDGGTTAPGQGWPKKSG